METTKPLIEIKFGGRELSGDVYITRKGTYIIDTNFDSNDPDFYTMTINDFDGEPCNRLKSERFKIVKEFTL